MLTWVRVHYLFYTCFVEHFAFISECYPNGTVTALAVKVESVRNLNPKYLTLSDQSCKPVFSNDRFAFFSFNLNSCDTTRTVRLFLGP